MLPYIFTAAEDAFWYLDFDDRTADEIKGVFIRPDFTDFYFRFYTENPKKDPGSIAVVHHICPPRFFYLLKLLKMGEYVVSLKLEHGEHGCAVKAFYVHPNRDYLDNEFFRFIVSRLDIGEGNFRRVHDFKSMFELNAYFTATYKLHPRWLINEYKAHYREAQGPSFVEDKFADPHKAVCKALMSIQWTDQPFLPKDIVRASAYLDEHLAEFQDEHSTMNKKLAFAIKSDSMSETTHTAGVHGEVNGVFIGADGNAKVFTVSAFEKPGLADIKLLATADAPSREYAEVAGLVACAVEEIDLSSHDMVFFSSKSMFNSNKKNNIGLAIFSSITSLAHEFVLSDCGFMGAVNLRGSLYLDITVDEVRACLRAFYARGIRRVFAPTGTANIAATLSELSSMEIIEANSVETVSILVDTLYNDEYDQGSV